MLLLRAAHKMQINVDLYPDRHCNPPSLKTTDPPVIKSLNGCTSTAFSLTPVACIYLYRHTKFSSLTVSGQEKRSGHIPMNTCNYRINTSASTIHRETKGNIIWKLIITALFIEYTLFSFGLAFCRKNCESSVPWQKKNCSFNSFMNLVTCHRLLIESLKIIEHIQ